QQKLSVRTEEKRRIYDGRSYSSRARGRQEKAVLSAGGYRSAQPPRRAFPREHRDVRSLQGSGRALGESGSPRVPARQRRLAVGHGGAPLEAQRQGRGRSRADEIAAVLQLSLPRSAASLPVERRSLPMPLKELIRAIAVELVDHPDQVVVTEIAGEHN